MPHTKFPVEILTPEGSVLDEEVEMIATKTSLGEIAILARHEPLLATLEPTELRVYRSDTEILRFAQSEGYIQVAGNHAMLLVQDAQSAEQLDVAVLRDRLAEAERQLQEAEQGSERARQAQREQRRWQAFLKIAEASS